MYPNTTIIVNTYFAYNNAFLFRGFCAKMEEESQRREFATNHAWLNESLTRDFMPSQQKRHRSSQIIGLSWLFWFLFFYILGPLPSGENAKLRVFPHKNFDLHQHDWGIRLNMQNTDSAQLGSDGRE